MNSRDDRLMTGRPEPETPDILGEILGGLREIPAPPAPKQTEWEYREVLFRDYRGWRVRVVNGVELGDWKDSPTLVEYLEQAGREGWELVSMGDRYNNHKEAYFKRSKA